MYEHLKALVKCAGHPRAPDLWSGAPVTGTSFPAILAATVTHNIPKTQLESQQLAQGVDWNTLRRGYETYRATDPLSNLLTALVQQNPEAIKQHLLTALSQEDIETSPAYQVIRDTGALQRPIARHALTQLSKQSPQQLQSFFGPTGVSSNGYSPNLPTSVLNQVPPVYHNLQKLIKKQPADPSAGWLPANWDTPRYTPIKEEYNKRVPSFVQKNILAPNLRRLVADYPNKDPKDTWIEFDANTGRMGSPLWKQNLVSN